MAFKVYRRLCPEAVGLLTDKPINPIVFDLLRKMKPGRQIETCKLMSSASIYSAGYRFLYRRRRFMIVAHSAADRAVAKAGCGNAIIDAIGCYARRIGSEVIDFSKAKWY
jgi:hypothetical protein